MRLHCDRVELRAHLVNGDQQGGERVVQAALDKYGGEESLLAVASHVYLMGGYSSNALKMLDRQLQLRPDDCGALINLGVAWIRLTNYANALPPLTRLVQLGTNNSPLMYYRALFNRAFAYDRNNQLDLAQRDFEEVQQALPSAVDATYYLADLGYRKRDTNLTIRNYELLVQNLVNQNVPTNSPQFSNVLARLEELKGARH